MLGDNEPWIVTDARVPCLVVEGEVSSAVDMEKIDAELKAAGFVSIDNVYNRRAYQLDVSCDVAFCISKGGRAAIVFFGRGGKPGDDPAMVLMKHVRAQEEKIQSFFSARMIGTIRFDRFGLEITGRNPN
jgi:hypothetical protein